MEKNEIKKALYKQSPEAIFQYARKDGLFYEAVIGNDQQTELFGENVPRELKIIKFLVPLSDIGDATFEAKEQAKLLIRYII